MLRLRAWDMDHFVIYSAVMDDAIPPKFEIKFLKCESTLECFLKRCWVGPRCCGVKSNAGGV